MPLFSIREFQYPEDYGAAIRLWEGIEKGVHLGASDAPAEIEKKFLHDPGLFLVAEANGQMIGTVIGGFDGRRGLVYHLAVAASFRGEGVGSRLMDELETRLRARGCLKCYLLVTVDNEEGAKFYERRGWEHMDGVRIYGKVLL